jgi:hypothetical protein
VFSYLGLIAPGVLSGVYLENKKTIVMNIIKTSEKILIWMHRNNITQLMLADAVGTTRQNIAYKLKNNDFNVYEINIIKMKLGFSE